jgi:LPPG:FO 2-phospho-L-lactate transferase
MSPFVGGEVVKGPTRLFCDHAGLEPDASAMVGAYGDLLDGVVADEPVDGVPALETDTLMGDPDARRRVAAATVEFAKSLLR